MKSMLKKLLGIPQELCFWQKETLGFCGTARYRMLEELFPDLLHIIPQIV